MSSRHTTILKSLVLAAATLAPTLGLAQTGHDHASTSAGKTTAFHAMTADYLAIQTALAGDSVKGVSDHAKSIGIAALELQKNYSPTRAGVEAADSAACQALLPDLALAAENLAQAAAIQDARVSFGKLSAVMVAYRGLVKGDKPVVAYCPMAKQSWLQDGKTINNPYYGSAMLRCGSIVEK
jgi:hypothetical protein